ncbi:MAG: hypothetical protein HY398_00100 [Candidatus Doudnabacteria bacterium]|nr:hypothetical protein [Candidatus Doudnabacteria bacterium]
MSYIKSYIKLGNIIRRSLPQEKAPRFSPEQIEKIKTASGIALVIIAAAGVIAVSAVAPNIFIAIDKLFLRKHPNRRLSRKQREAKAIRAFYYLKKHKYIRMKRTKEDFKIFLTNLGEKKVRQLQFEQLRVPKPGHWNRKWWQVAADIPTEEYKWAADLLRQKLKDMNFFPLQRTLWFYPYDPRKEVEWIVQNYGIADFVTVMEINRLDKDDERKMEKFFGKEKIL